MTNRNSVSFFLSFLPGQRTRPHPSQELRPRRPPEPEPGRQNAQIGQTTCGRRRIIRQKGPQQHVLHAEQNPQTGLRQAQHDDRAGSVPETGPTGTGSGGSANPGCAAADDASTGARFSEIQWRYGAGLRLHSLGLPVVDAQLEPVQLDVGGRSDLGGDGELVDDEWRFVADFEVSLEIKNKLKTL